MTTRQRLVSRITFWRGEYRRTEWITGAHGPTTKASPQSIKPMTLVHWNPLQSCHTHRRTVQSAAIGFLPRPVANAGIRLLAHYSTHCGAKDCQMRLNEAVDRGRTGMQELRTNPAQRLRPCSKPTFHILLPRNYTVNIGNWIYSLRLFPYTTSQQVLCMS